MPTKVTRTDISPGTTGSWTDVDVTSYVDAGNTAGVILHIVNDSSTVYDYGVRKNGSTDDRYNEIKDGNQHTWIAVGVDSNDVFEAKIENASLKIYIVGYISNDEGTFQTNATLYQNTSSETWQDLDISSDTGTDTALAAFFDCTYTQSTMYNYGLRKNGSTDNRLQRCMEHFGAMMACDANEILESYTNYAGISGYEINFYLTGWLFDSVVTVTNAVDYSTGTTGSYQTVDLSSDIPSGANGAFVQFVASNNYKVAIRDADDDWDEYKLIYRNQYLWTAIDSSRQAEQKIENTGADLYYWGYTSEPVTAVTRYWNPAADANWNDTSSWAETDGGATGASVPTSIDTANFTSTNTYECTIDVAASVATMSVAWGNVNNVLTLAANLTVSGTLTLTGGSDRYRLAIVSDTPGTARTITAGTVAATYCSFRDITGAGAGSWDLSAVTGGSGDLKGNTNITFSTPRTMYWIGGTGTTYDSAEWSDSSGGSGGYGVPRAQDSLVFDANSFSSGSQTVTIGLRAHGSMDFTNVTNSPTLNINFSTSIYGSLTLASGMSLSGTSALYFRGRSTHTITSAGKSFAQIVSIVAPGGTYTLQDALVNDGTFYVQNGTFDANDFGVTCQVFNSNYNGNTRVLNMGSGTWVLTSASYVWYVGNTGLTLNQETSTIKMTNNSSNTKYFRAGTAETYYNLWIDTAGTGTVDMYDASNHTFNQIKISEGAILRFKAGTTTTVTDFVADGTSAITLTSATAATHTLSCASGSIDVSYCTISYSIAAGGATWNAWTSLGNTDGGNNTGWVFTEPVGGAVYNAFWFGM